MLAAVHSNGAAREVHLVHAAMPEHHDATSPEKTRRSGIDGEYSVRAIQTKMCMLTNLWEAHGSCFEAFKASV